MKKLKINLGLIYTISAVICIICTLFSPRYGYRLYNGQTNIPFKLVKSEKVDNKTVTTYQSQNNDTLTLSYKNRFLGETNIALNGKEEVTIKIGFDGSSNIITGSEQNLTWYMHNIISNDSGGFFFWKFLRPLLILSMFYGISKIKINKVLINIIVSVGIIASMLLALRIL